MNTVVRSIVKMEEHANPRILGLFAAGLIAAIFILAVLTGEHYGFTWDEPVDLYFSERNLRYLLTFNPFWLNFVIPYDFSINKLHPVFVQATTPWRTLAFGNLLSSAGCYLFFEKWGLMNSIAAHHFPNKLLFAGMLAAVFVFTRRNFGAFAALAAIPAVAFQPRLWADMQFNLKDFPYACMMAFTMIAVRNAVLKYNWKRVILSAVLLGLSAATKPNAALIVIAMAGWFYFARSSMAEVGERAKKLFWIAVAFSPVIVMAVYILAWPYLWADPIHGILKFTDYYLGHSAKGPSYFQWDKIYLFLAVQPPAVLLFGAIGVAAAIAEAIKGIKRELNVFVLLWLFLPVIRVVLPRAYDYDGVRHFIEYAVPLGIFTATGFIHFCNYLHGTFLRRHIPEKTVVGAVTLFATLLPLGWGYTMYEIHPYELAHILIFWWAERKGRGRDSRPLRIIGVRATGTG